MKIVCVGYLHGAGGAERQIIMLSNALSERGHDVHLIILAEDKSKYDIANKVKIHNLTKAESQNGNKILNRFRMFKNLLNEIRPEISIHFWFQSAYFCTMMDKSITGKIIYSERADPSDVEYKGSLRIVRNIAFKRIDGFVFQSEGARDFFKESIKRKSIIIHNSVSIPEDKYLKPCEKREKKIVNVGRLHPQKNQKLLIDSFSKIITDFPEYTLEIYGEGELRVKLQKQIADLGLTERVFLKGITKDILEHVYTASLFVLSSDYEGMPNALMEAMSIGVPCISTDCRPGGARTLICNNVNGWITPIGDANLLSSRMKAVLLRGDNNKEIILNAMKIRETHSPQKVFDAWDRYCRSLVEIK